MSVPTEFCLSFFPMCVCVCVCVCVQLNSVLLPDLAVPYNLIYFVLAIIHMLYMIFGILEHK